MDGPIAAVDAAGLRDRRAMERFVASAYPSIWRLCALLVDDASADDLAQETFLRATRALPRFRGQADARTWILSIARRTCMDELRARYRRTRRDSRLAADRAVTEPVAQDPTGDVATYDLFARLEPDRRLAFVLTQMLRLTYDEAALVCECPTGTIRSRVARARDELIALIGDPRVVERDLRG
ncbi:MAG: sigma-70 family RNA polymerase sigma factor [Solirubrobacteraceae bacterium]|jgi:RNA polymerase sigma-70 factor (ECF subfamily)